MRVKLYITLNPPDVRRWFGATDRLISEAKRLEDDLPRKMAVDYVQLLVQNIMTQKFAADYDSYHEDYEKWKTQWGAVRGFWRLRNNLVNSLTQWKLSKGQWKGGITEGAMDIGGTSWFSVGKGLGKVKPISMYAKVMEYGGDFSASGGGKHPERPLFDPTLEEYMNSGAKKRMEETASQLRSKWV